MGRAILVALIAFPAVAGAGDEGFVLTWRRCVELAADRNPELQAARQNLRAAEHQWSGATSGYFPQISANASHTEYSVAGVDSAQNQMTLSATQNLFAGFRDSAAGDQASANRRSAAANVAMVRARVSADLKGAYAQLVYAQESLELATDIVRRREENQRLVQLRFEGGRENKGSARLAEATLRQARLDRRQASQAIDAAQAALARVLGAEIRPWVATDRVPLAVPPDRAETTSTLPAIPEIEQGRAQEDAAQAGIGVARAGLLPSLNLTGSVGRQGDTWAPNDPSRSVGLTLSVPIYSGGRDYHATESAVAAYAAARGNRENTERLVRARLTQAHHSYVLSAEKLDVDKEFVTAAALRAEISRSKYNNGLISFEDWDLIESDLVNRQKSLLLSARDRVTAEAAYEQVLGQGAIQ